VAGRQRAAEPLPGRETVNQVDELSGTHPESHPYPNEGHGVTKYPAFIDFQARTLQWFETHIGHGIHGVGSTR